MAESIADILRSQSGVISRRQALDGGETSAGCRRHLARREWVAVYPGVYVNHTGPLTWMQRAWCAVLDAHPAALSHHSALPVPGTRPPTDPVHIVIARHRRVTRRRGVVVHYGSVGGETVLWNAYPPRVRVDDAVLDVAEAASSETDAIAVLADAVQGRFTTASRLAAAISGRERFRRQGLLVGVLDDLAAGTCSVLEHGYLTRVERADGLPKPARQAPTVVGRKGFRDVDYGEYRLTIELDGRAHHSDGRARDRDMERDLDAAVDADRTTLRLGWGQVFDRACPTAHKVARALAARGWPGTPRRCSHCPKASAP